MEIRNIKGALKGRTFDYELEEKMTLITGRNESGKTAIIDAITLALRGFHPRVMTSTAARNNGDLLLLNDGKAVNAELGFSDDSVAFVRASVGFDKKIKVTRQAPSSEIYSEGPGTAMLDPNSYFSIGAKDRIRYVFSLVNLSDLMNWESIKEEIEGNIELETDDDAQKAYREVFDEALLAVKKSKFTDPKDILEKGLEVISEIRKEYDSTIDRMRKTLQQAASEEDENKTRVSEASLSKELLEKREEIGSMRAELQELLASKEKYDKVLLRIEKIDGLLGESEVDPDFSSEDTEEELKKLKLNLYGETDDIHESRRTLTDESDEIFNELHEATLNLSGVKSKKDVNKGRALEVKEKIKALETLKACPTCLSNHKGWRDKVLINYEIEISEFRKEGKILATEFSEASKKHKVLENKMAKYTEASKANDDLISEIVKLEKTLNDALRYSSLVTEKKAYKMSMPEGYNADRIDLLRTNGPIKVEEEKVLVDLIAQESQRKEKESGLAKMETDLMEVSLKESACSQLRKQFEKLKKDLCESAFDRVLGPANELCEDILPFKIVYRDEDIGYVNEEGVWVTHRLWCGMEALIGYAAIGLSLASQQSFRLLIMDDLGRLDDKAYCGLLASVEKAIHNGQLDQFIGVAPTLPSDRSCVDYTHIEV